ncbi:MAG: M61 family metallopeptidase [Acidobacteria bacterium]|nr:M61 family metallopeptidase [Acidobacteriota bacterium]
MRRATILVALVLSAVAPALAQAPVEYRLSFPEPEHHWMQVDVRFSELPNQPLELRMSRASPGRYALHEFAKNVYDVEVVDGAGRRLAATRPNPHEWDLAAHGGELRVRYKVFGDLIDGTYLAVDSTHAHLNMPAALMWARGLDRRPVQVTFVAPQGRMWKVATQLFPTKDPLTFTAPNLQYLMDSPAEFGEFSVASFSVPFRPGTAESATFRITLHHDGTDEELARYASDVEKVVREERAIYGELAPFDTGTYTFLADYLPFADGDGMEHRNSAVVTSSGALRNARQRQGLLGTVAHEFFHSWNVERIRPRSLEPFNFEDANMSGELWLAEGFTQYYGPLALERAGLSTLETFVEGIGRTIGSVTLGPGRRVHSAVEMSRLAPFVDAARSVDPTNFGNTFISYYTYGAAIALGLDLTLRDRTNGKVTLDDFMRAMWLKHGRPGVRVPGYVETPYTLQDVRTRLAEVSGDAAFANEFANRYIEGREVVDYGRLLARAGMVLRRRDPGRAWMGNVQFNYGPGGARVNAAVPSGTPAYQAGLDRDDMITSLDGAPVETAQALANVLARHKPGDSIAVVYTRRRAPVAATITLAEDPSLEVALAETAGRPLSDAERAFRDAWLGTRVKE